MAELRERAASALLNPRSVAVIGASERASSMSGLILRLLDRFHFPGAIYPVNPKYEELNGHRCYPSIEQIPADLPVDLAIVYLPAEAVAPVVEACGARGVKALVLLSAGFAETGSHGSELEAAVADIARRYNLSVAGPNCAGVANFNADFVAYGTTNFADLESIHRGGVALVSASGGLGNTLFTYCQERHIGVSHLIGLGNEAVTTVAEHVSALAEDAAVSVIAGYVEAIRDPVHFFAATDRASAAEKPIVLLKAGRSEAGQHSILTHTAAMGGSPEAFAGAFRQHGLVQVTDLDELVDTVLLLDRCEPTAGNRLGVFSLAGGGTSLVSDIAADHGFTVPELADTTVRELESILPTIAIVKNPVDPTAGFARDSGKHRAALRILASDPNIDVVVYFPLAAQVDYSNQLAEDLVAVAKEISKPVVCIWTAGRHLEPGAWRLLHENGVALFTSTSACFRAMRNTRRYALARQRRMSAEAADFGPRAGQAADPGMGAADLLRSFGVRFPRSVLATCAEDAEAAAKEMPGDTVVLKIASPQIIHKTEVGGVRVGVPAVDVATAFSQIIDAARIHAPEAEILGVDVQELVRAGVEMLVGVTTDQHLGPVVMIGMGGVLAETANDVAMRPAPVSRADVYDMLEELRGRAVLAGVRGQPPADVSSFVALVLSVSALADAVRDHQPEIDLNPVVVLENGAGTIALDHVVRLR